MVDLTITATSVLAASDATRENGTAGATITAGQVVYKDSSDGKFKLADNDSATAAVRSPRGIALNGASDGQPLQILRSGGITIGAAVTAGVAYYLSSTAGGICPVADLATGDYTVSLGVATSATVIEINMTEAGVALA